MDIINNSKLKRNFLFCLLSNIETDLRKSIINNDYLEVDTSILERLSERYKSDKNSITDDLILLIGYADLGDYIQILNSNSSKFIDTKLLNKLTKEIEKHEIE